MTNKSAFKANLHSFHIIQRISTNSVSYIAFPFDLYCKTILPSFSVSFFRYKYFSTLPRLLFMVNTVRKGISCNFEFVNNNLIVNYSFLNFSIFCYILLFDVLEICMYMCTIYNTTHTHTHSHNTKQ